LDISNEEKTNTSAHTFHHGIVITITLTAHAHLNVKLSQHLLVGQAGILAASGRRVQQPSPWFAPLERHEDEHVLPGVPHDDDAWPTPQSGVSTQGFSFFFLYFLGKMR
jgi:hypothetical protein